MNACLVLCLVFNQYDVLDQNGTKNFPSDINNKIPGNGGVYVYSVNDGFLPLREPKASSAPSGAPPTTFGTPYNVLGNSFQADGKTFWLICRENKTIHGWIPEENILLNDSALKTQDSNITKKALIINSKEWIKKYGNKPPVPKLGFLDKSASREPARFFNIMFVYKEIENKSGKYFLLGYSPNIINAKKAVDDIAGWFPSESICQWNTREAVQWNDLNFTKDIPDSDKREFNGIVFKSKDYIEKIRNGPSRTKDSSFDKGQIIAEEIISDGKSLEWTHDQPRYPKLSTPSEETIGAKNYGRILRVGVIGNFQSENGDFINPATVENLRSKVLDIKSQMTKTHMLFVIDDTSSMDEAYKKHVPVFLENVLKSLEKTGIKEHGVEVAICFYNDFPNNIVKKKTGAKLDQTITYKNWRKLDDSVISELRVHQPANGGDPLEQPIHGIKTGLKKAIESKIPQFSRKIVFVLGDMGNHEKDNLGQDINKDMEEISQLLNPVGASPWEFFPIQVPHPRGNEAAINDNDYKLFFEQMKEILKKSKNKRSLNLKEMSDSDLKGQIQDITLDEPLKFSAYQDLNKLLLDRAKAYSEKQNSIENELMGVVRGTNIAGTKFSPDVAEALSNSNIPVKLLTQSGSQLFEEGWITESDGSEKGSKQIRNMVFLNKDTVTNLKKLLDPFDSDSGVTNDLLEKLSKKITQGQVGDFFDDIIDVKKAFDGVTFKSKYLSQIFDLYNNKNKNVKIVIGKDVLAKNILRLQKISMIFRDIINSRQSKYTEIEGQDGAGNTVSKWSRSQETNKPRFFILKGVSNSEGEPWIWLDFDEEYP